MERRRFLKTSSALFGLTLAGSTLAMQACKKDSTTPVSGGSGGSDNGVNFTVDLRQTSNSALNNTGGSLAIMNIVIINTGTTFVALDQKCTHQGCDVAYNQSSNNLVCPCHAGTFSLSGSVISGPPPSPLKKYTISKSGDILTISD